MVDEFRHNHRFVASELPKGTSAVTELAAFSREENVLGSITLVFDGVNYGTVPVRAPYAAGKPIALYLVPSRRGETAEDEPLHGTLDCLITDDLGLAEREIL